MECTPGFVQIGLKRTPGRMSRNSSGQEMWEAWMRAWTLESEEKVSNRYGLPDAQDGLHERKLPTPSLQNGQHLHRRRTSMSPAGKPLRVNSKRGQLYKDLPLVPGSRSVSTPLSRTYMGMAMPREAGPGLPFSWGRGAAVGIEISGVPCTRRWRSKVI
jgi:hypothetical protein